MKQQVAELDAADVVIFHPAVPRDEAVKRLEAADLLYLNLKQNPTLERTIPSKVFDYLIAARPIVAGLAGEGRRYSNRQELISSFRREISMPSKRLCFPP